MKSSHEYPLGANFHDLNNYLLYMSRMTYCVSHSMNMNQQEIQIQTFAGSIYCTRENESWQWELVTIRNQI